jgi:acetyltransferase-like isoleucine patch superfamily enzyme
MSEAGKRWEEHQMLKGSTALGAWSYHPTSIVNPYVIVGSGAVIWAFSHVREGVQIGRNVSIGEHCYIGEGVQIGEESRIGNGVSVWRGVTIGKRVFVGPHVCFANDKHPRVGQEWEEQKTFVDDDASIGVGAVILPGIVIGKGATIGAGAVVTRHVMDGETWVGNPARMTERGSVDPTPWGV